MYILDIFFKRRTFVTIFEKTWQAIGDKISLVQGAEDETEAQRDLFYFVSIVYSSVFHSALAAGMSESTAHYLARIQTKRNKVDPPIIAAVEKMFSTPEGEKQQEYVGLANEKIEAIVASLQGKAPVKSDAELQTCLDELHQSVKTIGFSAEEICVAGH